MFNKFIFESFALWEPTLRPCSVQVVQRPSNLVALEHEAHRSRRTPFFEPLWI